MNASGRARVDTEVIDLSVLINTGLKGISAVLGKTERGPIDKTVLVGSWEEYQKTFGGLLSDTIFPLLCKRALDRGGKLRVGRASHYTDATDATTIVGTKASGVLVVDGAEFTAKNIGTWGNSLTITVAAAANGAADEMDITVNLAGYPDLSKTVRNIATPLTLQGIAQFNTECELADITSAAGEALTVASNVALAGGTADRSTIVTADYIGDAGAANGIHMFDDYSDFVKIAVPELALPEVDVALAAYAEMRMDCRAVLRTPTGISGATAVDYREGTGVYDHDPINSFWADMFFGTLRVFDTLSNGEVLIPAIADVLGAMGAKDNNSYEWFSVGGSKRGRLLNVIGIDYNVGTPARAGEFDLMDQRGVNAVINDADFGAVIWGNSTLQRKNTLLKHSNVADLVVFLVRTVAPVAKNELFDPNDIESWKAVHRGVRPIMELVKTKRGIWKYLYEGDQLIDDVSEAVVNTPANIDAGQYIFRLWFSPKVGMKYIGIKMVVSNSGVNFEELQGQPAIA